MGVRGVSRVVGVALIMAGCGGSPTPKRDAVIHLDGKRAQGNYVFETDASGTGFLVPAPLMAGQGSRGFEVTALPTATVGEPNNTSITAPAPYRVVVASATAVVPYSAHVEILAYGEPGRRFSLSWTETCGWTLQGKAAVGGTGGQGIETVRSPAVTLVRFPPIHGGVSSCYLAATASTTTSTRRLRLTIVDY